MLPEECQIHKLVPLFCSTSYTCVFVEPYKKEMKKKNGGGGVGEEKRQIALLLPGIISPRLYRGWRRGSSVKATVDSLDGAAAHHAASQMLIII